MASFVSANELQIEREKRKKERQIAREEILKEAKEKFLKEKKRQELKRERGDDKWVAPGISDRFGLISESKKKKKDKKKHKKHKQENANDGSDNEMWVKAGKEETFLPVTSQEMETSVPVPTQRQDWMMMPLAPSIASTRRLTEIAETEATTDKEKLEAVSLQSCDKPGQHPRELNPYWKDGGYGLPQEDENKEERKKIGDGGRSWLLRAYKRALERSEEEGIRLEEIATDRWGSLENLYSKLQEAGIDPKKPDHPPQGVKRHYLYSRYDEDHSHRERRHSNDVPKRSRYNKSLNCELSRSSTGFMKPGESSNSSNRFLKPDDESSSHKKSHYSNVSSSQSWRKKEMKNPHEVKRNKSPVEDRMLPSPQTHHSPSPPPPPSQSLTPQVTNTQLNALGAKVMKAELMGDSVKAEKLKKKLEELRELKQSQEETNRGVPEVVKERNVKEEVIVLTRTDRFGQTRPVDLSSSTGSRYSSKQSTHTDKGKRKKYFHDDDNYSLKGLVEQERISTAEDTYSAIARMASKFVPSSNYDETVDDAIDLKSTIKRNPAKDLERSRQRAIAENRAMNKVLDNCKMCIDNDGFDKHLLIAVGMEVYLAVPSTQPLTEGHCLIIPREHVVCSLQLDENVWSEVSIFRKGLTRMFSDHGMDVVFMETYYSTQSKCHMCLECIPLPKDVGEMAPMYFKKAIMECDEEWSDNKKLVDTKEKGTRGSLPKGLPYFFVEFGIDNGYGHVIEDRTKFPKYFGKEICGGMLDVEPHLWLRPHKESFEKQKLRVLQLSEWWKPYDWTQQLKEQK